MIRGNKRPLPSGGRIIEPEVTKINVPINASIHNRFDIEVVDTRTGEIKQRAQAENIICNQLWTRLFTPAVYFKNVHYGTGTGTPDVTDTSLFNFFASLAPIVLEDTFDTTRWTTNGVVSLKRKFQILESAAVGQTITEVGIAYGTAANNLCTHAMLKDMNGNQISLAKTDTDVVNIYATTFVHFNISGYDTGHIKLIEIAPVTQTENLDSYLSYMRPTLMRWLLLGSTYIVADAMPHVVLLESGGSPLLYSRRTSSTSVYSVANKTCTIISNRITADAQNLNGGAQAVLIVATGSGGSTASFNVAPLILYVGGSWYSGTNIVNEAIAVGDGVTKDFATKFNYASNAAVYVNGIIDENVIVNNVPHKITNPTLGLSVVSFLQLWGNSGSPPRHSPTLLQPNGTVSQYSSGFAEGVSIYENRLSEYGLSYIDLSGATCACSDDRVTWYPISTSNIPEEHRHKRFWKFSGAVKSFGSSATFDTPPPTTNIHFDVAPSGGAVITADYFTKTIAKDENHVFDLTVTIQLGEYTET